MTVKRGKKRSKTTSSSTKKSSSKKIIKKKTVKKTSKHSVKHKKKPSKHKKPSELKKIKKLEKKVAKEVKYVEHEIEEEFFMPSPRHVGKYHIPLGIKFLIGYLLFISSLYIISFVSGLSFPTTILFGKIVAGQQAVIFNAVLLVLIGFMIFGFWKRKSFAFDLAISFFGFSTLNSLLSLTLFDSSELLPFKKLMLLSFVSLIFMNIVVIWYILHERKYFYAKKFHDRPVHQRDKVFLYIICLFWIVALLVGSTLGMQFYKDSKVLIDDNIKELSTNFASGDSVCSQKTGADQDVCYLVLATAKSYHNQDYEGLCDKIDSDFFRFSCARSTSGEFNE